MIYESDKDKGKYAYIQIIEYDFSDHHEVVIKSNNDAFLNYVDNRYPTPDIKSTNPFITLLGRIKSCYPEKVPDGVRFRYRKSGYRSETSEEIISLANFCTMIDLKLKICDNRIGKYRGMDIKKLPKMLEKLDSKYSQGVE